MKKRCGIDARGVSTVEFALLLPLLVTLVFGIIEFSILLYDKAMITNASREGARAGIIFRADAATGNYTPLTEEEIEEVVDTYAGDHLITFAPSASEADVAVTYEDNDGSGDLSTGDTRIVTVSYVYDYLVLPNFVTALTGVINLEAETQMRME